MGGMDPIVSSGTTACMTLFTSASGAVQYLVLDTHTWDYFLYYIIITFLGGLLGRVLIRIYLKRGGGHSVVVIILAVVLSLAFSAMCVISVESIREEVEAHIQFSFDQLCP